MLNQKESTLITIIITYEGLTYPFQRDMDEKLENFISAFSSNINECADSIIFLYNGSSLKDVELKKTFWHLMNNADKQ